MFIKTVTIFLSAVIITTVVLAQQPSKDASPSVKKMEDGIMKKGDKIWSIKNLTGTITLSPGIEINSDGVLKIKRKTRNLTEGDCINFRGELVVLSKTHIKIDSFVMRKNHAIWVWRVLKSQFEFGNGNIIMPDGTLKTKDGKPLKMKDDEFIDLNGNSVIKKEVSF